MRVREPARPADRSEPCAGLSPWAGRELRAGRAVIDGLRAHDATDRTFPGALANLFIVSEVSLVEADGPLAVTVERALGSKCERCWTYSEKVGRLSVHPGVCERCAEVLSER